jgi:glycosyltransferase involved in cell wall biosynthesis
MTEPLNSHIVMLGAAPQTRGSSAAVVEAYRAAGLFRRLPIEYIATSCDGSRLDKAKLAASALHRFARALIQHRRLAVHIHLSAEGVVRDALFMAAALAARCPLIVQLHGTGFDAGIRAFLERAAWVVVSCESQRAWLRSVARNANAVVVPPPVSVAVTAAAAKPNLILFLGRLCQGKGIYDLLEAVSGLRAAVPDVRLACAGDGERIAVARYAECLGIADAVKFTGWVGPSGKRALLESAAAFALPSYQEALPVSLIEAMSAGVPAVASPVGGIPEVLQDGVSGFLVAPGDKAGLERALRNILLDRARAERLGAAARESARLRFQPERALAVLEELYASIGLSAPRVAQPPLKKAA